MYRMILYRMTLRHGQTILMDYHYVISYTMMAMMQCAIKEGHLSMQACYGH